LPAFDYARVDPMKQLSYATYGKPREEVEADVRRKFDAAYGQSLPGPASVPDIPAPVYQ